MLTRVLRVITLLPPRRHGPNRPDVRAVQAHLATQAIERLLARHAHGMANRKMGLVLCA
jgi:hypothetical protein